MVIDVVLDSNLTNRGGLIESAGTLAVRAASVDNQSGKLRALGVGGKTNFQIGSLFDNRNGLVETANTDLTLATPSFLNAGGTVTHVGVGEFDISTANVMNAGGSLVTRGGLTLNADSWTNSSVIQAGRLTVNVNNFVQTASGQLLASNHFEGRGVNWTNDGLIASDGDLDIQLSGGYGGNGRMSSLGDMQVDAPTINLTSAASIAGGGNTVVGTRGGLSVLNNYGHLTAANNFNLNAGAVNNYGTLAGGAAVKLTVSSLLNDQSGFLFSGGNMRLRVGSFSNKNSDVYSLGNIDIARDDAGNRSALVENLSGTMESTGYFMIRADSIVNRRDQFKTVSEMYSADIGVRCDACDELPVNWAALNINPISSHLVWEQKFRVSILEGESSKASSLTSGSDLDVSGGTFLNSNSSVAASENININVANFENSGTATGDYVSRQYVTGGQSIGQWSEIIAYNMYNDANYNQDLRFWNTVEVDSRVSTNVVRYGAKGEADNWFQRFGPVLLSLYKREYAVDFGDSLYSAGVRTDAPDFIKNAVFSEKIITADPSGFASAIIQAAGNITINATNKISNGVERAYSSGVSGTSRSTGTGSTGTGSTTVISLNSQLPPDLAQQQVNPLTLPGFSLPVGDNGMFRLSDKNGTNQTIVQSPPRTIGSVSVGATQRPDGMPVRQATELQFDENDPVSVKKRELALASRPSVNLNDKAAQVNVNAAAGGGPVGVLLPNSGNVSFNVPRVQGLPDTSVRSNPHKYLIETNPVLTNLKQFMSSDYLLANLGYDPDTSAKRLGDGLFEQRLVQQSIVARTGQRFLDGQTSDEAMFKYLMNNAIASKDQLNLSMGVTLTSQQVAALTHDIVWLEEHVVNGEKVLVPVLYLAQANNRLAPNGALIQGGDVTLIAGQDLNNAGTLRATNNLSAEAGNDLTNTGLIEAGDRLTLKAGNNIVNKSGGIISGRDVTLTATNGDVINQRDVIGVDVRRGGSLLHRDYLDNAARIEAANDLSINAGRDINNIGGVLQSGRDLELIADRDVNITSVQDRSTVARGSNFLNQTITQHAAEVTSGRDLSISADRDVAIVASRLDAKRDIGVDAGNDIVITSAANESDYVSRSKRQAQETHSTTQQASVLNAGRDIALNAGNDLGIIASRIKAQEDISLDAVQDITVASAKDESSSYYYRKKTGSFGRSSTTQKESYDSTNVASVIEAGHDLTVNTSMDEDGAVSLDGGRNVTIIGSQLKAGNDLVVGATNDVAVLSATEETGDYSKKTKTGLFGMSSSGKSQLQTTVTQIGSELNAGHDAVVIAGRDVRLNASEINADNDAELHAGLVDKTGDITLSSADDLAYSRAEEYKKKLGLTLKDAMGLAVGTPSFGGDITFNASHKEGREVVSSNSVGSQVNAGHDAILNAARDINIIGSGISADNNAKLDAGRDVNVVASTDQQRSNSWETDKSFGLKQTVDNNGYTTFVGNETIKHGVDSSGYTAAGSSIDTGMNLNVTAGRDINQQGSDLEAGNNIKLKAGRNINIDAAEEASIVTTRDSVKRTGSTTTVTYNFGNTVDSLKGTGKGEDGVSKGSSVMKSVDALDNFFSGPKFDGHIGSSSTSQTQTQTSVTHRPSSLSAGGDITLEAENDVNVKGSQFDARRDINVTGRNITFDVAHGAENSEDNQTQSKGGIKGGTTGGFKLGVGISNAGNQGESSQGTSTATQLNAGGSVNLDAKNDLTLIGTQATAERDIKLKAGNDLNILSAQNAYSSENTRRSWGAEGGIIAGQDGFGVYGSANVGIGDLDRQGVKQQEANLHAGNSLSFESGRDTTIAGATLRGDEVIGDVGRNLTVTSVPNTGKVEGKEFDASLTVAVSFGVTASGSLGYGQTNGKTNWVENQTVISGKNKVDIRTENNTQLDGSVIAADNGNLKLDTDTLGFRNITGKDNEHGYYLNVSGSYGSSGGAQADKPNKGMEGGDKNSWAVEGYNYTKDREQTLNATVGAGQVVVRHDKVTGDDSTTGLNRDVNKAYEVTRDEEHRTDLYASDSSINAALHPVATLKQWTNEFLNYDKTALANFDRAASALNAVANRVYNILGRPMDVRAENVAGKDLAESTLKALLLSGKSREDAMAMMGDPAFIDKVLASLAALNGIEPKVIEDIEEIVASDKYIPGPNTLKLAPLEVTPTGIQQLQGVLLQLSAIQVYIKEHPGSAEAVGYVMAAAQGPKGVAQFIVMKAIEGTEAAQAISENVSMVQAYIGQKVAEAVEGTALNPKYKYDSYLIGGGELITSIMTGVLPGKVLGKGDSHITVGGVRATATVIDTAPMAQRVMDVRAGLPSDLRRSGNVAVAEIDIPGIPMQMAAHSQVSDAGKGLIGSGNGNFVAQSVPNKAGDLVYRGIDTEYKILDNIADQLGGNTSARGTVNILTEKAACASCLNVAEQFKAKYPNITVNILDNQGVMLRPPRKTP